MVWGDFWTRPKACRGSASGGFREAESLGRRRNFQISLYLYPMKNYNYRPPFHNFNENCVVFMNVGFITTLPEGQGNHSYPAMVKVSIIHFDNWFERNVGWILLKHEGTKH